MGKIIMKRIELGNRVGRLGWMLAAALIAAAWVSSGASAQTLNTLVTFSGSNGANPQDRGGLIADAHGNLFGTTSGLSSAGYGTVFEIKTDSTTATGYASTPTTLVSFNGTDGSYPFAGLMADAHGNLFGTTSQGGAYGSGTVFEIKIDSTTATGYASTPTTLVSFNSTDGGDQYAGVIADASGNLFGTALFPGLGTVYEIKTDTTTATGYATTPTNLVIFNNANGQYPFGGLIADASGNLFGTTYYGGAFSGACYGGCGTVYEIKVDSTTPTGYASTPTTLVSFNDADGAYSESVLIVDAHGNLFGTTSAGGTSSACPGSPTSASGCGTVFELKVDRTTATGYASTPTTLVSFNGGTDGLLPFGGLIADTQGNLFGTTSGLGSAGYGTVFEIKTDSTTATGYASTPTTLVSFNGLDGAYPIQTLIADLHGNLFGTAESGGATGYGTVIEVTGSGFVPPTVLQSITVSSSMISVAAGLTQQFTATGHYSDGSTQNLTSSVTWSSSNTSIATIASSGLAQGVSAGGPVTIMASLNSITGTAQLTVTAPMLVSIAVTPANPSVPATTTQQFTATGTYTGGSMKNLTGAVTWSSSNMAAATINASGLASALSAGTSMISAALGGVSGSTTITVITARVQVTKTFNGGAIPSGSSFTFQLRSGASSTAAGTILESETFTSSTAGGTILFTSLLIPGQQYETCEQMLPGWLTTLGPPLYSVFNPSGDNSVVCTNFTPAVNQTVQFTIDNHPPPGGMALGIGFWKNWASCANNHGNQTPVLDRVLASFPVASGQTTPGVYIGNLYVNSCAIAEDLLNRMTLNGTKEASNPSYSLAAQLLAAKLNVQAGAGWTVCVSMDISSAGNLLNPVQDAAGNTGVDFAKAFNSNTGPKLTSSQATTANYLQTQIDYYNNNQPVQCPPGYVY
jgi:uncharacterized repeat protein (TIGR03803 family)